MTVISVESFSNSLVERFSTSDFLANSSENVAPLRLCGSAAL